MGLKIGIRLVLTSQKATDKMKCHSLKEVIEMNVGEVKNIRHEII